MSEVSLGGINEKAPFLSVVIPAWNEAERLPVTLEKLERYRKDRSFDAEILVVDDGSTDATRERVQALTVHYPHLKLLTYDGNHGKGYAVKYGMLHSRGKYVLFADADGSTPWESFDAFLPQFDAGADVVIGSRYMKESHIEVPQPLLRRILSRVANKLIQVTIIWGLNDTQCGFKAFTHTAAHQIFSQVTIDRWGFDMEVLAIAKKRGMNVAQVPVHWMNSANTRLKLVSDTTTTLHDLFVIKMNILRGRYNAKK